MSVRRIRSLSRSLAYYFAVPSLGLLASSQCIDEPTAPSLLREPAVPIREQPANGNPVIHWNRVASELMVTGPVLDSRAFTILHVAIHDAVNGVERRYAPYTVALSSPDASLDAAVATAARDVILAISPAQQEKLEQEYRATLAAIPNGRAKEQGVRLGRRAAQANLERRANDKIPVGPWPPLSGPIAEPVYVPNGKPGDYAFTPPFDRPPLGPIALFPGLGRTEPFAIDLTKHRLAGPDAITSEAYVRDFNHLKAVGSLESSARTADQTETAFFWFEDFPVLNQIAVNALEEEQVDPWQAARTLALMHLAIADAGIACFEAKYRFRFWRPYTAIRQADDDGNPKTSADTSWLPLLWTPLDNPQPTFLIPPIPDYPSAAATVSSAAAAVLVSTLGDRHEFEATSPFLPGVTRRFSSFTQAAEEAAMSRVYGGIHFLRAVRDGLQLGESVGREVSQLLPPVSR